MTTRAEKIGQLSDQQALSILDSLTGEFIGNDAPERKEDQMAALQGIFDEEELAVHVVQSTQSDSGAASTAAKQLLLMMAQVPEIQPSLDEWLDHPTTQEAAAIPLLLAAPVVYSGCIAFLYVVGHVHFKRNADGTWKFGYDPAQQTAMDKMLPVIVQKLADVIHSLTSRP